MERSAKEDSAVAPASAGRGFAEPNNLWYGFWQKLGWSVVPALFRVRVIGRENLPRSGGVVIASNHQSYLDPIFLAVGLSRPLNFLARASLFRNTLFGALIRSVKAFPVRRDGPDVGGLREAIRRLQAGSLLLIFPEGTRSADGRLGELKDGFVTVAARAGAHIVPTVIEGANRALPRGRFFVAPCNVWVAFGRPLASSAATSEERKALSKAVRRQMEELQGILQSVKAGGKPMRQSCAGPDLQLRTGDLP